MVAADTLAELTIDKPPHLQRPENMANVRRMPTLCRASGNADRHKRVMSCDHMGSVSLQVSREDAIAAAQKAIGMLINSANG